MTRGESAEEVVELCDRALVNGRLAPGLGWTDTEWGFELRRCSAASYVFSDRLDRAESLFTEGVRAYETAGWSGGHLAVAHASLGYVYRRRGRLIDAEALTAREPAAGRPRRRAGCRCTGTAASMLIDTLLARGQVRRRARSPTGTASRRRTASTIYVPDTHSVRGRLLLAPGGRRRG